MKPIHPLIITILEYDAYVKSDIPRSLSATTFLSPIQKVILSKRHKSSIDIKLNSASLLGTALHEFFEKILQVGMVFEWDGNKYELLEQEYSMNTPIGDTGFTATGTSDLIFLKNDSLIHIGDFKSCKDFTLKDKSYDKWVKQLSIYALLVFLTMKKPVDKYGTIFYFNKTSEAASKFPFGTIELELMPLKETKDFIMEKTLEFKKYWDLPDSELPRCSDVDNWGGRLCGSYCGYSHVCQQMNVFVNGSYNF